MCLTTLGAAVQTSMADDIRGPGDAVVYTAGKVKEVLTGGKKSFGIDAGSVYTDNYDLGFGVGARLNQTYEHPYIYRPFLRSSPGFRFWGASNETTDISVIGIIENLTHIIPMKRGFTAFAGLTFGYYYIYKTIQPLPGSGQDEKKTNTNSFDIFVTVGGEYDLKKNTSLFVQIKYGETAVSREFHTQAGFNFRYWKEENR
jgi:hypothetical protein